MRRRRSKAFVRPVFSTSRSIALQKSSRTWGTTTIVVTRCSRMRLEDDARGAAADVEDVGADRHRVEERR